MPFTDKFGVVSVCVFVLWLHIVLELLWLVHLVACLAFYVVRYVVPVLYILVQLYLKSFSDSPISSICQHISCLLSQQLFYSTVLAPFLMFYMFFACKFDTNIIYNQCECCWSPYVASDSWSELHRIISPHC